MNLKAHRSACKLMELHTNLCNSVQAHGSACKPMLLHASLFNWASRLTSSRTTGGTSGTTSGSFQMDSGMSNEWSRVVSAEVKEE